jgi:NTP pyrophosphatase (non-canonical NTP hydrolase)
LGKTLQQVQQEVDAYISQFEEGYFQPLAMLARLTEEVGELARELNHHYGEKQKKPNEQDNPIDGELGDLLFILVCFANSLQIDLDEAFAKVMEKYRVRDAERWTRKTAPSAESK